MDGTGSEPVRLVREGVLTTPSAAGHAHLDDDAGGGGGEEGTCHCHCHLSSVGGEITLLGNFCCEIKGFG